MFQDEKWLMLSDEFAISNFGRLASLRKRGWYYHICSAGWCITVYIFRHRKLGLSGPSTSSMRQAVKHHFGQPGIDFNDDNMDMVNADSHRRNKQSGCDVYYKQMPSSDKGKHDSIPLYGRKPLRKCTTCGKPTDQWRCKPCWDKVNAENGVNVSMGHPEDEYKAFWGI